LLFCFVSIYLELALIDTIILKKSNIVEFIEKEVLNGLKLNKLELKDNPEVVRILQIAICNEIKMLDYK